MESNYFEYFVPKPEILGVLSNHFSLYRLSNMNSGEQVPFLFNEMEYKEWNTSSIFIKRNYISLKIHQMRQNFQVKKSHQHLIIHNWYLERDDLH